MHNVPVRYKIFSGLAQIINCLPKPVLQYLYSTRSGLAQVDTCLPKPLPVLRIWYFFEPWIRNSFAFQDPEFEIQDPGRLKSQDPG
jgi:hypothetical protein